MLTEGLGAVDTETELFNAILEYADGIETNYLKNYILNIPIDKQHPT